MIDRSLRVVTTTSLLMTGMKNNRFYSKVKVKERLSWRRWGPEQPKHCTPRSRETHSLQNNSARCFKKQDHHLHLKWLHNSSQACPLWWRGSSFSNLFQCSSNENQGSQATVLSSTNTTEISLNHILQNTMNGIAEYITLTLGLLCMWNQATVTENWQVSDCLIFNCCLF